MLAWPTGRHVEVDEITASDQVDVVLGRNPVVHRAEQLDGGDAAEVLLVRGVPQHREPLDTELGDEGRSPPDAEDERRPSEDELEEIAGDHSQAQDDGVGQGEMMGIVQPGSCRPRARSVSRSSPMAGLHAEARLEWSVAVLAAGADVDLPHQQAPRLCRPARSLRLRRRSGDDVLVAAADRHQQVAHNGVGVASKTAWQADRESAGPHRASPPERHPQRGHLGRAPGEAVEHDDEVREVPWVSARSRSRRAWSSVLLHRVLAVWHHSALNSTAASSMP